MTARGKRLARVAIWLACAAVVPTLSACGKGPGVSPSASSATTGRVASGPASASRAADKGRDNGPRRAASESDVWEAVYLQGAKIGYSHSTERPIQREGQELLEVVSENHLKLLRFRTRMEQHLRMSTVESGDGAVLEFRTELAGKTNPTIVTGHVSDGVMHVESRSSGASTLSELPWSNEIGGFRAIEQSLERHPMKPGEKRSLKMLSPLVNQVADVELTAVDFEQAQTHARSIRLLRVESVGRLPDGNETKMTLWTDEAGRALRSRTDLLQQETRRTSREFAMAVDPGRSFDLGEDVIVRLNRPVPRGHDSREVRYLVQLEAADPAALFATGPTQSVRSLDAHTAHITVRSIRPGSQRSSAVLSEPDPQYLSANSVLDIDDPEIRTMAEEAKGKLTSPRDIAVALERYVKSAMVFSDYTQGFATASEVVRSRRGDCTEHSVLLAALARVCEIPSRVATGLVYVPSSRGFAYHMWTEVVLEGQWVPLDATMGRGGIGAAHLKLGDSSLKGASAHSVLVSTAQVVGQLKIAVLEAR